MDTFKSFYVLEKEKVVFYVSGKWTEEFLS